MVVQLDRRKDPHSSARVTISDVSEALGLTKSTVSRALNGYPDISESTRQRVRHMANKIGYRPLSHAQAIRTGRTKSLGFVIQMADHDSQRPFLAEFLSGLSQGASAQAWTLTIAASTSEAGTIETIQNMIRDRKVDGFILPRTEVDDSRINLLRAAKVPFVLFGRNPDPADCAWFDVLGEDAMHDAVVRLHGLGHRKIGFINGGMRYTYGHLRRDGFASGMAELDLRIDPAHVREDAVTIDAGAESARQILASPNPPTAIICSVDMAAIGVYRAVAELGLTVGKDVSVISYDGIPDGAHLTPQLSTFAVDYTKCGTRLSELLIKRILGGSHEILRETTHATYLDRGSAAAPEKTSAQLAEAIALKNSTIKP